MSSHQRTILKLFKKHFGLRMIVTNYDNEYDSE